jgi:ferric iron reductase protein FhuF
VTALHERKALRPLKADDTLRPSFIAFFLAAWVIGVGRETPTTSTAVASRQGVVLRRFLCCFSSSVPANERADTGDSKKTSTNE